MNCLLNKYDIKSIWGIPTFLHYTFLQNYNRRTEQDEQSDCKFFDTFLNRNYHIYSWSIYLDTNN